VSDATAASDTAQKIGLFLSLDAAVASDTENHCPCKWAFTDFFAHLHVLILALCALQLGSQPVNLALGLLNLKQ
jgi:hypothetical protein